MNGIIEVEMGMTGILKANMKESALLTMQLPAGRIAQFSVCFRNALTQFFVHRSWMVLPMTAVLSLIAGFAIRDGFLTTMEETMTGAFLLTGLCIWNGSYSSIQAICREREVIRQRDRLKLYLLSYSISHMLFQLLVCAAETGIMMLMLNLAGVRFVGGALITGNFALDFTIIIFLILYAADIVALFLSALCRTKTAAMTILPFELVLQLVFSGSIISIPDSIDPFAMVTVSRPGFKAMASLADINHLSFSTVQYVLDEVGKAEVNVSVTLGQVLELLSDESNPAVAKARATRLGSIMTVGELMDELLHDERLQGFRDISIIGGLTVGVLLNEMDEAGVFDDYKDKQIGMEITLGKAVDFIANSKQLAGFMGEGISIHTTADEILNLVGREKADKLIQEKAAENYYNPDFDHTTKNMSSDLVRLLILTLVFAVMTILSLEFVVLWRRSHPQENLSQENLLRESHPQENLLQESHPQENHPQESHPQDPQNS